MQELNPRELKAKCMMILQNYDEVVKFIAEKEIEEINKSKIEGENEFEIMKKVFTNEGIKEGLRKFIQKLNYYSNQDI